jgi:hypothetical protein
MPARGITDQPPVPPASDWPSSPRRRQAPGRQAHGRPCPARRRDLSGIGAATSLMALTALVLARTLGWWRAGRATALVVAAIATAEA